MDKLVHTVNGITIAYRASGNGLPLVMLHGRGADYRVSLRVLEPVFETRTGWRRIYPDLPGSGETAASSSIATQDDMLTIVEQFITAVTGGQRFALGGMSYGGYLALGIAQRQADRLDGLLLVVPSVERDRTRQRFPPHQVLIKDPAFEAALRPDEEWLRDAVVVQTPSVLEQIRAELLPALQRADTAFLDRLDAHPMFSFDFSTADPLWAPALILAGRQDSVTGYREAMGLLERYPRGTFAVLDGAGHMLHREQTVIFRALVNDWVDRVEMYRANRMIGQAGAVPPCA